MRRPSLLVRAAVLLACAAALASPAASSATPPSADDQAAALLAPPTLTDPLLVTIAPGHTTLKLSPTRDYDIRILPGAALSRGLIIMGGHNVILRPGTLRYVPPKGKPDWLTRGAYFKGQTGTMYVSGLTITGPLNEGIDLDQRSPKAAVVLNGISVDPIVGSEKRHHADLLQTWAGPSKLVVKDFTGSSDYQGFFLEPNQQWNGPKPALFWMKDVDLDVRKGYYGLWTAAGAPFPLVVHSTVVRYNRARPSRDAWLWPKPSTGDHAWDKVIGK